MAFQDTHVFVKVNNVRGLRTSIVIEGENWFCRTLTQCLRALQLPLVPDKLRR